MANEVGHHWIINLSGIPAPFNHVNMDTVIMAWVTMALLVIVAFFIRKSLQTHPGKLQIFGETMYDFCRSITMQTAGERGDAFLAYVGSLFIFILTANLIGQMPLRFLQIIGHYTRGELVAPTGDFNTPAALAVFTLVVYFFIGLRRKGIRYFLHYFKPNPLFLPINIMEDFTRPFSLMIRLYANILVGEILSGIALTIMPYVLPVAVIFLEIFVAVVQAYIFAILSSVYISVLSAEDH